MSRPFILFLRLLGAVFVAVAGLHLTMGLGADALLGSPVTPDMTSEPSFDAQNRFYGICFALMGCNLIIASVDLRRFEPFVWATFAVLFVSGIGRLMSWLMFGAPAPALIGILVVDLFLPPITLYWFSRVNRSPSQAA